MSTLSLRKIKHDSSAVDNITLGSNGHVGIGTDPLDTFNFGKALDISSTSGSFVYVRDSDATNGVGGIGYSGTDLYISNKGAGNIKFLCNNDATLRMNIDSNGRVTMPYQPAFQVRLSGNQSISTTRTKIAFDTIDYQNGSDFSTTNNRFTAPVTGWYSFSCWTYGYTIANNELSLYKNGGIYLRSQWAVGSNLNNCNAILVATTKLAAGDYVEMFAAFNTSGQIYHSSDRPSLWTGYLVA